MAKYYQYLIGENRGKVTTLKEIDDSMSDMILYVFDDGFRCNEELIAPINVWNVQGKIMAEVENPNNVWKFSEKEIAPEVKEAFGKNGQNYEIPDPYFVDKNGNELGKKKREIIMQHPRRAINTEPLKKYYISNQKHDEISDIVMPEPIKEIQAAIVKPQPRPIQNVSNPINSIFNYNYNYNDKSVIKFFNEDTQDIDEVSIKEIINIIRNSRKENCSETDNIAHTNFSNEATELYNKCKKSEAEITLKLELELPTFELFKTIRDNYPEDWPKMFIENIVYNLDIKDLQQMLVNSLFKLYDSKSSDEVKTSTPLYD